MCYNLRMKRSTSITWQYLAPNAKSCYKQLFVKRTRIRARVLYGLFMSAEEPMTPEEIAAEFSLPLPAVSSRNCFARRRTTLRCPVTSA